jgi:glutamate-ammonia-ligase adenylyltransferase
MVDELMDSLEINKLAPIETLRQSLRERCRGAEDLDPILHSFRNAQHLNAGVRDILGKEDIRNTTAFLSDVAEVCLQQVTDSQFARLTQRYGQPWIADEERPCELIILGMGKLGGREPNYHSDLDVVFVYEADGSTRSVGSGRNAGHNTTNQHFFSELAQRIIKQVNRLGPLGRLYELDARLRPTGKSGTLAVSLDSLQRYFSEGLGQLWERQALCRARPIYGSENAQQRTSDLVHHIIGHPPWKPEFAKQIYDMRRRMEENASRRNLKRSQGGIVDVEFIAQMLQMKYALRSPAVLCPGTIEALTALETEGHLNHDDARFLCESYRFLRSIEARLRLMNTTARHDLPEDEHELRKLAYLLDCSRAELVQQCTDYTENNRRCFERVFANAQQ